ncbi:T9SS type A sorting domain-containing protein [Hanstruepera ponticola]|uniref:T9SS type A sorting domain-containing protein n=1 Tax=Hanstruepera ponticola TaxID=2042995 RepID=UPI000CF0A205|nr:T9SS type A sorting domain-containing protein [Hanstruepera ponticola]
MKQLVYVFVLLLSLELSAQDIIGEWFLYSITIDGDTQSNTFSNDFTINFIEDTNNNEISFVGHAICNDYGGTLPNVDTSITIELNYFDTNNCAYEAENQFEEDYFSVLQYNNPAIFNYHLVSDNPGYNNRTLTITNEDGDILTFGKELIIEDNPLAGEWFLYEILNPSSFIDEIPQIVSIEFINNTGVTENPLIINGVCNSYTSNYLTPIYESSFAPFELDWTPSDCSSDTFNIDMLLHDLFNLQFEGTSTINYQITGTGNEALLEISQVHFGPGHAGILSYIGRFSRQLLSVGDVSSKMNISIFPNPTDDFLHVSNLKASHLNYSIFSTDSKKIIDNKPVNGSKIGVSFLEKGIYILQIGNHYFKFIKK